MEAHHGLSIFSRKRENVLHNENFFTWCWLDPETREEEGRIGITMRDNALHLNYRVRWGQGAWEEVSDTIFLSKTMPAKGGFRWWFLCPSCGKRRAKLYLRTYFRCRACLGLCYGSQLETERDRALRRFFKRRQALGGFGGVYEPFPQKPKWMRWASYQDLVERDVRDLSAIDGHTQIFLDRLRRCSGT